MKTDVQLKKDVTHELEWDPSINATHIGVAVEDGVVTLTGHLPTFAEKQAAEDAARRVAGVRAIAVELDVRLEPRHQRSDAEIAAAIGTAFKWHAQIPDDRIQMRVEKGWVTLTGEVDWEHERHNAESAARPVSGVVGVINQLALRHRDAPKYIAERIHDALVRAAEAEARDIHIDVKGDTVTLSGSVSTWAQRTAAQAAAWCAPGVARIVNQIKIAD